VTSGEDGANATEARSKRLRRARARAAPIRAIRLEVLKLEATPLAVDQRAIGAALSVGKHPSFAFTRVVNRRGKIDGVAH
jgi:hypothetical protein